MLKKPLTLILALTAPSLFAAQSLAPLVNADWLAKHACEPGVVVLDIRSEKIDGQGKFDYLKGHIPCAVHTDYAKAGWRVKRGNVPAVLPPVDKLESLIGGLGIDGNSRVVLVPRGKNARSMSAATRVYWTFKVLGHDRVSILNGGLEGYMKKKDRLLTKAEFSPPVKTFKAQFRNEMVMTKEDVRAAANSGVSLVDNRSPHQYLGVNRHAKANRSGTIPGAVNLPTEWLTLNNSGTFRSKSALTQAYTLMNVPIEGRQVNFCNTGHLASLGWFVSSELLGNKDAKMYDGSMVEWSADARLPVDRRIAMED